MRFGSGEFNAASSVQQTSDGGYIIAGSSGVIGGSSVLVAKLSTAGGYIVGGEVVAESPEGTTPGEALLLKLSSAGAIRFQDVFNAGTALNFSSHGTSIRQTGRRLHPRRVRGPLAEHGTPAVASWLVKTTSTGALSWQHIFYGPSDFSDFQSVRLTGDGGYIAAGVTGDFADADNFWLVNRFERERRERELQGPTWRNDHRASRRADGDNNLLPHHDASQQSAGRHHRRPGHNHPRGRTGVLTTAHATAARASALTGTQPLCEAADGCRRSIFAGQGARAAVTCAVSSELRTKQAFPSRNFQ